MWFPPMLQKCMQHRGVLKSLETVLVDRHGRKIFALYGCGQAVDPGQHILDEEPGAVKLAVIERGLLAAAQHGAPLGLVRWIHALLPANPGQGTGGDAGLPE